MNLTSSTPLITTIIPTYRRPKRLQRAIRSVLNQTYPHIQVCVYDNASGDETASIVAEMAETDPRIKYHRHSENIGALRNFAYGIDRVDTTFFSCLSDDDFILQNFYKQAVEVLETYPEVAFFVGATAHVNEKGKAREVALRGWKEGVYKPPLGIITMLQKGYPNWTGIVFRKTHKEDFKDVAELILSDLAFVLKLAKKSTYYVSPVPVGVLTLHQKNQSAHIGWPELKLSIDSIGAELGKAGIDNHAISQAWEGLASKTILGYATEALTKKQPRITAEIMASYHSNTEGLGAKKCVVVNFLGKISANHQWLSIIIAIVMKGLKQIVRELRSRKNMKYLISHKIKLDNNLLGLVKKL